MERSAIGVVQDRVFPEYVLFLHAKLLTIYRQRRKFQPFLNGLIKQHLA
jgi:hypothetical protein